MRSYSYSSSASALALYTGRYNHAVRDFFGEERGYNWWMILPDSICGLINMSILIAFIIKKKNNPYLEGIYAIGMLGCISNIIYPNYIEFEPLWQLRSWGGLLHHLVAGWLLTFLLIKDVLPLNSKDGGFALSSWLVSYYTVYSAYSS